VLIFVLGNESNYSKLVRLSHKCNKIYVLFHVSSLLNMLKLTPNGHMRMIKMYFLHGFVVRFMFKYNFILCQLH